MKNGVHPAARGVFARGVRALARAWRGVEMLARTTGRAARGTHGSRAMIVVWLICAVFASGLGAYGLAARTPGWFDGAVPDRAEARRLAQRLENRIITEAYRFRGGPVSGPDGVRRTGEDWRLRVSEEEATAWLTVRFPEWLANRDPPVRMPPGVGDLRAHFANGRAWIAGRVDENVYSISSGVRVSDAGVRLAGVRAGIGSLWWPVSWGGLKLVGLVNGESGSAEAQRLLGGGGSLIAGGAIRLEDGRRVRILEVTIGAGALEVGCRTEAP